MKISLSNKKGSRTQPVLTLKDPYLKTKNLLYGIYIFHYVSKMNDPLAAIIS